MMKTKCKVAILVFLAIGAGQPQTLSAAEGTPPLGCITVTFSEKREVEQANIVNNCGHNDIGVWAGTNWSEPFALPREGPRDKTEALDIDDFTHAILRMPSLWPSGDPFSDDHDAVKPDFAVKLCAHHIPGIDYELAVQLYDLFGAAMPASTQDPRTDSKIRDGFIALTQTEIPSESLNCLKREVVDTYPAGTWGSGPGTWNSCMELGTTALGRKLLKFYRENRGVCHQENLINASLEPGQSAREPGQSASADLIGLGSGMLGRDAGKAVNQWAAALKADPAWKLPRTLIFLVQSALVVQGHDPGKPNGVMSPETMLALLAWSPVSGPLREGDDSNALMLDLANNVAYLLHGTLLDMGLEPGSPDEFLGWRAKSILKEWASIFAGAAFFLRAGRGKANEWWWKEMARNSVTSQFGLTEASIGGLRAQEAIENWQRKNGIPDTGSVLRTIALMVQTALALQNFDPGPADGVFGKKTLAAILAWQAMHGYAERGNLVEALAGILHAALVLEGYDPGSVEAMFGPAAIKAIQVWAPAYEQATVPAAATRYSRENLGNAGAAAGVAGSSRAGISSQAQSSHAESAARCLKPERGQFGHLFLRNACDYDFSILLKSESGNCASNDKATFPCGMHVDSLDGAYIGREIVPGRVTWIECDAQSVALEEEYGKIVCAQPLEGSVIMRPYLFPDRPRAKILRKPARYWSE